MEGQIQKVKLCYSLAVTRNLLLAAVPLLEWILLLAPTMTRGDHAVVCVPNSVQAGTPLFSVSLFLSAYLMCMRCSVGTC